MALGCPGGLTVLRWQGIQDHIPNRTNSARVKCSPGNSRPLPEYQRRTLQNPDLTPAVSPQSPRLRHPQSRCRKGHAATCQEVVSAGEERKHKNRHRPVSVSSRLSLALTGRPPSPRRAGRETQRPVALPFPPTPRQAAADPAGPHGPAARPFPPTNFPPPARPRPTSPRPPPPRGPAPSRDKGREGLRLPGPARARPGCPAGARAHRPGAARRPTRCAPPLRPAARRGPPPPRSPCCRAPAGSCRRRPPRRG